ncbi:MAG: hypothetical protein CMH54_08230, partial [Myxococcales bacterium]|nr:hypothetical protein [Myxococcales bacterium]
DKAEPVVETTAEVPAVKEQAVAEAPDRATDSGSGEVNCTSACDHVLKVVKAEAAKEIENLPAEQKKMAADMMSKQMDGMKGACVEECKKDADPEKLKCALAAKTMADIEKCD